MALSSRKKLSIAPCFIGGFSFYMQGISNYQLTAIESRESFLKCEDVQWTC